MTGQELIDMNKRAAHEQAEKMGWDKEQVRVCVECGRTVLFHKNEFNGDSRQGKVYCTCDETGYPMVKL